MSQSLRNRIFARSCVYDEVDEYYGVWSDIGWLDVIHFPLLIIEQSVDEFPDYEHDSDFNVSAINAFGKNVFVMAQDLEFLTWTDLNPIEQKLYETVEQRGVQLQLVNIDDSIRRLSYASGWD